MTTTAVSATADDLSLDDELAALLAHFSNVQDEVLESLTRKRDLLIRGDSQGLAAASQEEMALLAKLEACQAWRQRLLQQASAAGIAAADLRSLGSHLPGEHSLQARIRETQTRFRLLHHHSLTNWVLAQRTVLHLAQVLEIIATGGRPEPTYTNGEKPIAHGALVDQAA